MQHIADGSSIFTAVDLALYFKVCISGLDVVSCGGHSCAPLLLILIISLENTLKWKPCALHNSYALLGNLMIHGIYQGKIMCHMQ